METEPEAQQSVELAAPEAPGDASVSDSGGHVAGDTPASAATASSSSSMSIGSPVGDDNVEMRSASQIVNDINANITKIGGEPIELSAVRRSPEPIAEVFGRGRFLDRARLHGLSQGFALDLSTGWGLNIEAQR